jgi:hypothetical protein
MYQRYAATLYRQALLTPDEDDGRHRLARSVSRRLYQLVSRHVTSGRAALCSDEENVTGRRSP